MDVIKGGDSFLQFFSLNFLTKKHFPLIKTKVSETDNERAREKEEAGSS
jgi:hypothetical protein